MSILSQIIYPIKKESFLLDYWENKHLYIPSQQDKFKDVFDYVTLSEYLNLHGHSLQYPEIRVTLDAKHVSPEDYHEMIPYFSVQNITKTKIDPEKLNGLLVKKASLILSDIQEYNLFFQDFAHKLSKEIERKINITLFHSSEGLNSFKNHCDPESAFIIQLKGQKRWTIFNAPPASDSEEGASIEDLKELATYVLKEGDVLYLPKGVWHNAKAENGSSLSVTVTMTSVVYLNLYVSILESFLLPKVSELEFLYKDIPMGQRNLTEIKERFLKSSSEILNEITEADIEGYIDELINENISKNGKSTFTFPLNPKS